MCHLVLFLWVGLEIWSSTFILCQLAEWTIYKRSNRGVLPHFSKSRLFAMDFAKLFCNGFIYHYILLNECSFKDGKFTSSQGSFFPLLNSLKVTKLLPILIGSLFPYNIICPQKRQLIHFPLKSLLGIWRQFSSPSESSFVLAKLYFLHEFVVYPDTKAF